MYEYDYFKTPFLENNINMQTNLLENKFLEFNKYVESIKEYQSNLSSMTGDGFKFSRNPM